MRRGLLAVGLLALAASVTAVLAAPDGERRGDQGAVHFVRGAPTAFEPFIARRDPRYGAFLRRHMWRLVAYSPYFDSRTRWYPSAWAYDDAYAIYRGSRLAARHADWILRDGAGRPLFIPYGCGNGACPQYAADISNPAFRRHWIADARAKLRHRYRGLFVDDVNMEFRVGNGHEDHVAPVDRATGRPMTYDAWRGYMAEFMQEIRAALPRAEIVHNAIWFADAPARAADPYISRQIQAADYVALERGFNDSGLTGGSGAFSTSALLAYVDAVHALGKGVILDGEAEDVRGMEYELAAYLLISEGNDLVSAHGMTPTHWWSGFDVNLGDALARRERWRGLLRRDFSGGMTLLNEPDSPTRSVTLPSPMRDLNGRAVSSVTLAAASGVVLKRA
jgi:Hypothetical glycosyl hydrolase family 15